MGLRSCSATSEGSAGGKTNRKKILQQFAAQLLAVIEVLSGTPPSVPTGRRSGVKHNCAGVLFESDHVGFSVSRR
jgi:hypothetical protein